MRRLVLIVISMVITSLTFAQSVHEKQVPAQVNKVFHTNYPTAKNVKWDKEGEMFEVNFDQNNVKHSVVFDHQGNIHEIEVKIELSQLPKGLMEYVKTHYKQAINGAAKIIDVRGAITYEAEIKGMDLIFDANGKFMKEMNN